MIRPVVEPDKADAAAHGIDWVRPSPRPRGARMRTIAVRNHAPGPTVGRKTAHEGGR